MSTFYPIIGPNTPYGGGTYGSGPYGGSGGPLLSVELDVTNQPTNPVRVWTDITQLLRQLAYTRSGRSDELQRTSTGTLFALVDNRSEAFTSLGVKKAQWIRVQTSWLGVTSARWQGILTSLPRRWPSAGHDDLVELRAEDALKVLRLYDLAGLTFGAQRNDQRISALLALAGLTAGSIDTSTDAADAVVTPYSEGSDALSLALDIEASENGLLIANPDGTVSFQGRHWRTLNSATSTGTFGETGGQIPYRDDVAREDDDTRIANIVSVTPAGGSAVVVSDPASQAKYFARRLNRTLQTSSLSIATDAASYLLNRYKDPSPRLPEVTVQLPAVAAAGTALVTGVLNAANSSRFTWNRAATTPISDGVYVEQISETVVPGSDWLMQFQLSPAIDEAQWRLDDPVNGILDSTTRLVY